MSSTKKWFIGSVVFGAAIATIVLSPYLWSRAEPGSPLASAQVAVIAEAIAEHQDVFADPSTSPGGRISGATLLGRNPRGVVMIRWRTGQIGADGEPLDPWGQPFSITLERERGALQVRSAGRNGILGDSDDEVAVRTLRLAQRTEHGQSAIREVVA